MTKAAKFITSMTEYATAFATVAKTPVPVEVLFDILRRPRFTRTEGERYVIEKYLLPLPGATMDEHGNIYLLVGHPNGVDAPLTTMFSSHTDTVHKATATDTYKLSLKGGWLSRAGGGVLGADCGTGIWIMLNLIKAQVPGLYVFHRDEEIGGKGSTFFAKENEKLVGTFKHCIAFDRKGERDVITEQSAGVCCSDEFADAFSRAINLGTEFAFRGDDTGSFTDSANYMHLISECTNLSVGYYDQHTQDECQDLTFASHLVNTLIGINFSQLPAERDHTAEPDLGNWDWANYRDFPSTPRRTRTSSGNDFAHIVGMTRAYPDQIADILMTMGYTADTLAEELITTYDCDLGES